MEADRGHIHHRLLEQGLTPRRAALLLYGVGALAAVLSLSIASGRFEVPVLIVFCVGIVLMNNYHDFGFYQIDLQLAGRSYHAHAHRADAGRTWRLEIPLSDSDFIHLGCGFNAAVSHNALAPFANSVRTILEKKIPDFTRSELAESRYQVAVAGD